MLTDTGHESKMKVFEYMPDCIVLWAGNFTSLIFNSRILNMFQVFFVRISSYNRNIPNLKRAKNKVDKFIVDCVQCVQT